MVSETSCKIKYLFHDLILQAGIFMGFSITSAVFGGLIIIGYSVIVSGDVEGGLAAVILTLGIIEFGAGIWVSICLCLMKPCCNDSQVRFLLS